MATTADQERYMASMPGSDGAKMAKAMDYLSKEKIENIFEKLTSGTCDCGHGIVRNLQNQIRHVVQRLRPTLTAWSLALPPF